MSPSQARADKVVGLASCHVSFKATTAAPPSNCLFGDPNGRTTVVLVGDSHAQHWFPALDALAKQKGWRLYEWSKDSCAMNDAPEYLDVYARAYPECAQWRASVLSRLRTLGTVDHVVVARSWKYGSYLMDGDRRLTGAQAIAAWRDGAAPVQEALTALAPDVVVMSDGPRAPGDIPTCLSEHVDDPQACAFPRQGHIRRDAALTEAEKAPAQGRGGIRFVDPTDLICATTSDRCPAVTSDGTIVYRDDSHMTATFSRSRATALEELLDLDGHRRP
jgi:hypothetical protein